MYIDPETLEVMQQVRAKLISSNAHTPAIPKIFYNPLTPVKFDGYEGFIDLTPRYKVCNPLADIIKNPCSEYTKAYGQALLNLAIIGVFIATFSLCPYPLILAVVALVLLRAQMYLSESAYSYYETQVEGERKWAAQQRIPGEVSISAFLPFNKCLFDLVACFLPLVLILHEVHTRKERLGKALNTYMQEATTIDFSNYLREIADQITRLQAIQNRGEEYTIRNCVEAQLKDLRWAHQELTQFAAILAETAQHRSE